MDLEELKIIWDSQNKDPLFTLNQADLHAIIQRRIQESNHCAACHYRVEISISIFCGLLMLALAGALGFGQAEWLAKLPWPKVAPSHWDLAALLSAGGIWLYFAFYLNRARLRLQRCGETFESSLRGDIDRALARVAFQIKIAKGIVWWGFIPAYAAVTFWVLVVFRLSAGPGKTDLLNASYVLAGSVMVAAFMMDVSCRQRAIRERYEPHRRELESLHRKLANPLR
jgi:hypothetical protein